MLETECIDHAGCIIGEPSGMQPVVAHKGKRSYRCRVRGHEAHSSLTPLGVNAVQVAGELVTFLAQLARRFRDRGGFDAAYDVPYTTVHTGVIRGGNRSGGGAEERVVLKELGGNR